MAAVWLATADITLNSRLLYHKGTRRTSLLPTPGHTIGNVVIGSPAGAERKPSAAGKLPLLKERWSGSKGQALAREVITRLLTGTGWPTGRRSGRGRRHVVWPGPVLIDLPDRLAGVHSAQYRFRPGGLAGLGGQPFGPQWFHGAEFIGCRFRDVIFGWAKPGNGPAPRVEAVDIREATFASVSLLVHRGSGLLTAQHR
jgi:hypothetical protein